MRMSESLIKMLGFWLSVFFPVMIQCFHYDYWLKMLALIHMLSLQLVKKLNYPTYYLYLSSGHSVISMSLVTILKLIM